MPARSIPPTPVTLPHTDAVPQHRRSAWLATHRRFPIHGTDLALRPWGDTIAAPNRGGYHVPFPAGAAGRLTVRRTRSAVGPDAGQTLRRRDPPGSRHAAAGGDLQRNAAVHRRQPRTAAPRAPTR